MNQGNHVEMLNLGVLNARGDLVNDQDNATFEAPVFIHTTLINCQPGKADDIGPQICRKVLRKTQSESGCYSTCFYRRVIRIKNPPQKLCESTETDSSEEQAIDNIRSLDENQNEKLPFYSYPSFPSKQELSQEIKPHEILDIGRWATRSAFEEHLVKPYILDAFSSCIFDKWIHPIPLLSFWGKVNGSHTRAFAVEDQNENATEDGSRAEVGAHDDNQVMPAVTTKEFLMTRKRTFLPTLSLAKRRKVIQVMNGLAASAKSEESKCVNYDICVSEYAETADEMLEIGVWTSWHAYEAHLDAPYSKANHKINSFFLKEKEETFFWETLLT